MIWHYLRYTMKAQLSEFKNMHLGMQLFNWMQWTGAWSAPPAPPPRPHGAPAYTQVNFKLLILRMKL